MSKPATRLAANLKWLRLRADFTQDLVGQMIGCTRYAICKYETADRSPNINQLRRLAKVYQISIDDLLNKDLSGVFSGEYPTKKESM